MTDITNKFWERLHLELDTETDRSISIVAGALIDEALKETLKARLIPAVKKDRCVLNGGNSPIGSFSSRIDLCYQLGLISGVMQRDLHIVRKLRNDFAHNPFDLSFESESVKNRIKELDDVANYKERNAEARLNCGPPGTKHDFIFSISWRLYNLTESIKDIRPLKSPVP
jgi:DNA-binding MltR family transcriptional regulator